MKKTQLLSLLFILLIFFLTGCKSEERLAYNYNLKKYVTLPDNYKKSISIKSDEFSDYLAKYISNQVREIGISTPNYQAIAQSGDTVNITYYEKTADENEYITEEITAGDNTFFIEEIAKSVIGKKGGDKFEITYSPNEEKTITLNVIVNYVYGFELNDSVAQTMGYGNSNDALKAFEIEAQKSFLLDNLLRKSTILQYPQHEYNLIESKLIDYYTEISANYELTLEDYVLREWGNEKEFKKIIDERVKNIMNEALVIYAIADKESLTVTEKELNEISKEEAKNKNISLEEYKQHVPDSDIELMCLKEKVFSLFLNK